MHTLAKMICTAALLIANAGVQAASIWIESDRRNISDADIYTGNLMVDFSDAPTVGGGFDITFSSNFSGLYYFDYNDLSAYNLTPRTPVTNETQGLVTGIGFDADTLFGGSIMLATLYLHPRTYSVDLPPYSIDFIETDSFIDPFGNPISVTYTGATGNIYPWPIPPAVWLFSSGLAVLGLQLRRH